MMQKAINAEAKASLRLNIMVWDVDFRYSRSYFLSQNTFTKIQTQVWTAKKSKPKESRLKDLKLANEKNSTLPRIDEPGKISYQDKKKEYFKKKRDRKNSTLAIKNNAIEGEKKRNNQGNEKCYNS